MDSVDAPSAQARDLIGRRPPLLEGGNDSSPGSVSSVVIEVECPSRIRLVERDGILITIDNRRLEAFRRAKTDIPTVMATSEEIDIAIQQGKFSAGEHGTQNVRVRGRKPQ